MSITGSRSASARHGRTSKDEGRFLGGRPPYGYLIADAGPHPSPCKAADGKRLHKLDRDPEAAPVIRRIFAEFIAGHGAVPSGRWIQPVCAIRCAVRPSGFQDCLTRQYLPITAIRPPPQPP